MHRTVGSYTLTDDPGRLDARAIHAYLTRAYWSQGIPLEVVERALSASLSIGAYDTQGVQVGLARFISDFATFCYVCDVYVLEQHRGQGLAKAMMAMAVEHPKLQGLRRWSLATRDAHSLYAQYGFTPIASPQTYMELLTPDVYTRR
jgi:GNAT superfamily N-acetyltransferase